MARSRVVATAALDSSQEDARIRRGVNVPDAPDVSIIVLVTTRTDRLQRCLRSIAAAADGALVAEILVLANGTPAPEVRALATRDDIVLIRSAVNHGFGGGCNWTARFARGARLVFINDDAVVTPGWLRELHQAMDDDPRIGVVGSRVLFADGRLQEAGNVIWRDGSTSCVGRTMPGDEPSLLANRDWDYVSFCSAMVRREAWDQAGGFDERYFPAYYEDADLCLSVRALGWRVICAPASVVIHEEGVSTPVHFRHFLSRRNQQRFAAKWRTTLTSLPERPSRTTARAVTELALQRHGGRGSDPHIQAVRAGGSATVPSGTAALPDADMLATELRHSHDDVVVKDEYIATLLAELEGYGAISIARKRYEAIRRGVGRQVRRSGRLARLADLLMARTGRRS
jgi:GT2 family glycosyltransferase